MKNIENKELNLTKDNSYKNTMMNICKTLNNIDLEAFFHKAEYINNNIKDATKQIKENIGFPENTKIEYINEKWTIKEYSEELENKSKQFISEIFKQSINVDFNKKKKNEEKIIFKLNDNKRKFIGKNNIKLFHSTILEKYHIKSRVKYTQTKLCETVKLSKVTNTILNISQTRIREHLKKVVMSSNKQLFIEKIPQKRESTTTFMTERNLSKPCIIIPVNNPLIFNKRKAWCIEKTKSSEEVCGLIVPKIVDF